MPKKVNRNPGIGKRGDKWQARAFFQPRNTPTVVATSFIAHGLLDAYEILKEVIEMAPKTVLSLNTLTCS